MSSKIIYGVTGLIIGSIAGYIIGGTTCAKHYKTMISDLEEENDRLNDEVIDISKEQQERQEIQKTAIPESDMKAYKSYAMPYSDKQINIRIIDEDAFRKDLDYRDNETVTYYQQDGVLADSADMPIHNEEELIGIEALDELAKTNEDFLYVSNDDEDKMYEVIVDHSTNYYRDLMGAEV